MTPKDDPTGTRLTILNEIAAERQRQISAEGWTPAHDDEHDMGELAQAAGCYAIDASDANADLRLSGHPDDLKAENSGADKRYVPRRWPFNWAASWWKPKDPRRNLIRAAALIVAEIERIDRLTAPSVSPTEPQGTSAGDPTNVEGPEHACLPIAPGTYWETRRDGTKTLRTIEPGSLAHAALALCNVVNEVLHKAIPINGDNEVTYGAGVHITKSQWNRLCNWKAILETEISRPTEPEAPTPEIAAIDRWWYSQVTDDFDESPQATKQRLTAALAKMETLLHALRLIEARTPVVDSEKFERCARKAARAWLIEEGFGEHNRLFNTTVNDLATEIVEALISSGLLRAAPSFDDIATTLWEEHVEVFGYSAKPQEKAFLNRGAAEQLAKKVQALITPHAGGK